MLDEIRSLGRPVDEQVQALSYLDLQQMRDDIEGHAFRRYWKGHYFREFSDAAIDAFVSRGTADGHGDALPYGWSAGPWRAIADVPDEDAYDHPGQAAPTGGCQIAAPTRHVEHLVSNPRVDDEPLPD